jgi:NAD kinase
MSLAPRAVLVHRRTELDELVDHHGTMQQAEFFLKTRGQSIDEVVKRHELDSDAIRQVRSSIPIDWRRGEIERDELRSFAFAPGDVVMVVGQDGLVANVAKYLAGEVVIGFNSDPERNPGVLVSHTPDHAAVLLATAISESCESLLEHRTMVEVITDDGIRLLALNEVYVGSPSHQSARYRLALPDGSAESQSSSGVLVGTGTGSTGWCRSLWLEHHSAMQLPEPEDEDLVWFVREAWPSPATGVSLTEGLIVSGGAVTISSKSDGLVVFGDGIESDRIALSWGQSLTVTRAHHQLRLLGAPGPVREAPSARRRACVQPAREAVRDTRLRRGVHVRTARS